jgi:hypothetical protein
MTNGNGSDAYIECCHPDCPNTPIQGSPLPLCGHHYRQAHEYVSDILLMAGHADEDKILELVDMFDAVPNRNRLSTSSKWAAVNALTHGQQVLYAIRCPDGAIKIGCTKRLAIRSYQLHGQILGFTFGDFPDEAAIHDRLRPHLAHGQEYYHPTPAVMAVVNDMRDTFGMDHITH